MGTIGLNKCRFFAKHGYYPEERVKGNQFEVSVSVQYDVSAAAQEDALELSLNYENLYQTIKTVMLGPSVNLLEHLSHQIIRQVKTDFKGVKKVKVKLAKLNPPVEGDIESAWVELEG